MRVNGELAFENQQEKKKASGRRVGGFPIREVDAAQLRPAT
jgi:hypothetical protein